MSFVIFFTVKGDSQELLAGYDKTVAVPYPQPALGTSLPRSTTG